MRNKLPMRRIFMPVIDAIIPEITKQCIEPISEQLVHRLIKVLGFDDLFSNAVFITSDDLQNSNFDDETNRQRIQNNRCDVKIVPGYNPLETMFDMSSGYSTSMHSTAKRWMYGEFPVFSDPRSRVNMFEVTIPCAVELQFTIRVKSIELSDAVNTMLFSRYLTGGSVYDYNDIQFSYPIADSLIVLLYKIYKMQQDINAKMTFQQYLATGSNDAICLMVNKDRLEGSTELIMQRYNTHVLGKVEYAGDKHETEDINKVSNRYVINFSYFYQFSKPALSRISYPIMINNNLIEGQYVGKALNMSIGEATCIHPHRSVNDFFYKYNKAQIDLDISYPKIQYPYYDDWRRSNAMYADIETKYQTLFIGLLKVHVDSITGVQSLSVDIKNEIFPLLPAKTGIAITKLIQELNLDTDAFQTYMDIFRRLSIFDIAIFNHDKMIPFGYLNLTDELVLTVNTTIDITKLYRVVISQIRDISILNNYYIYYMLDNPEYYEDFLAFHMSYLVHHGYVKIITDVITQEQSVKLRDKFTQRDLTGKLTPRSIIVNNFVVDVQRKRINV